ncbi:MAG TPA: GNAT family N-acetyltransferase [Solirubrobacterales bacterium]|nr:GNAT family N-acetyltransferase [Solirubrobacterales bacterium]
MAVELREARSGDELPVAELHVRSWQEAYRGLMPAEFLAGLDPRDRAGRYRFEAEEGPTMLLAVIAEGAPGEALLGFVSFGRSRDEDLPDHGEIRALYVDPDRHRGGVGRLLMAEARRRLAADGYAEAFLWVLDGNDRAREFYEREGWVADGAQREENVYDIASNVLRFRREVP